MPIAVFLDNRLSKVSGGGEQATMLNMKACINNGWRVRVITQDGPETRLWRDFLNRFSEIEVIYLAPADPYDLRYLIEPDLTTTEVAALCERDDLAYSSALFNVRAAEVLRSQDADLLVVSCLPDLLGIQATTPVCLHVMGVPTSDIAHLERPLLRRANEMVFVSQWVRDAWHAAFGLSEPCGKVATSGISSLFIDTVDAHGVKKYDCCFAGRFTERKGIRWLVEAMVSAKERKPDLSCVFLGDGPLSGVVNDLCNAHPESFHAPGSVSVPHLVAWLDVCRVFIYPVLLPEAFGLAPLEAMARGLPALSSGLGGLSEYMQDEVNSLFVTPDVPETLTDQTLRILSDARLYKNLSDAARQTAAAYPESASLGAIMDVYRELIDPRDPST